MQHVAQAHEPRVPASVGDLLAFVEELPPESTGELVLAVPDEPRGVIFVENNRICWAAARGLSRRLAELLRARVPSDAGPCALDRVFESCRAERRPIGEALVQGGLMDRAALRDALRIHTAESIVCMLRDEPRGAWNARPRGGYGARFTFATGEILAQVSAGLNPSAAERARERLGGLVEGDDWGAAFVGTRAEDVCPIASHGDAEVRSRDLLGVGRWAASELQAAMELSARRTERSPGRRGPGPLVSATTAGGGCAVAWCEEDTMFVVQTTERGLGRVLRRRADGGRGGG